MYIFIIFIVVVLILIFVHNIIFTQNFIRSKDPEYQKALNEVKINSCEKHASILFQEIKPGIVERINMNKKMLMGKSPLQKTFGLDFLKPDKKILKKTISNYEQKLEMENIYLRLKEKFKHNGNERLKLATDWSDYTIALSDLGFSVPLGAVDTDQDEKEMQVLRIKIDEIEKRFFRLLKQKISL